ncbi:hypothetical protein TIFTF001_025883 [Ficus carica]|uniref:non-specific serine/threonine protein kinase n=1 Tax=Ficus carica TaxID=3494 RepID=A0AA88DKN1_FICCA|nr:hypothetical protein TIFTF001_025883 [Ficus carica]
MKIRAWPVADPMHGQEFSMRKMNRCPKVTSSNLIGYHASRGHITRASNLLLQFVGATNPSASITRLVHGNELDRAGRPNHSMAARHVGLAERKLTTYVYAVVSYPLSFLFLSLLILFLSSSFASHADDQDEDPFKSCEPFDCGGIKNISYPFRGNHQPEYCGHPEFVVDCELDREILIVSVVVPVMEEALKFYTWELPFGSILEGGFEVEWNITDEDKCEKCVGTGGGRCGHDSSSTKNNSFMCFCPLQHQSDGLICRRPQEPVPEKSKVSISLVVGFLFD